MKKGFTILELIVIIAIIAIIASIIIVSLTSARNQTQLRAGCPDITSQECNRLKEEYPDIIPASSNQTDPYSCKSSHILCRYKCTKEQNLPDCLKRCTIKLDYCEFNT